MFGWGAAQKSLRAPARRPTSLVASPSKKLRIVPPWTPVGRKKRRLGWTVNDFAVLLDPEHGAEPERLVR